MLGIEHLDVYAAFNGDIDGWARSGGGRGMTDGHWALIEELRHALFLCSTGWASDSFAAQTESRLMEVTDNEEVRCRLRALASGGATNGTQAGRP